MFVSKRKFNRLVEELVKLQRDYKELKEQIEPLERRIKRIDNPYGEISFSGNLLRFNGDEITIKPPYMLKNNLDIKYGDTITGAESDKHDIHITMASGDKFVLRGYWNTAICRLERE